MAGQFSCLVVDFHPSMFADLLRALIVILHYHEAGLPSCHPIILPS
jgi:hypothetical protein